ncbi:chlorite dismutase family protein (plasmid) [Polymorphobacter sp. PAMC 29334]|uniref:chlorite dismutase family protein n=1 Tax=Polymorphobacter sp. PAMC 29334 TaxID=2862331 RepID=UPI001C680146|nr:chlorite dismutase family protein [Polymorphobacter sp. PAMC 29334]QYE33318.1 chlorite dismutase family protein [Polymorphobacter sp. PAMC 29334]
MTELVNFQWGNARGFTYIGGDAGSLTVINHQTVSGEPIEFVQRVDVRPGVVRLAAMAGSWTFAGVASNDRYTTRSEKTQLVELQAKMDRSTSTRSALIFLRKSDEWWALTQDERRGILEEKSHHIAIGMRFLPAVARRLLHCRDLGETTPFDFIGHLDFAPSDADKFDDMLGELRRTEEWSYIDREIDIRLQS